MDLTLKTFFSLSIGILLVVAGVQAAVLRDPTLPPASGVAAGRGATESSSGLRLEGFRKRIGGRSEAMINGRLYRVGDEIDGRRVMRVDEGTVVLRGAGGEETLRMPPAAATLGVGE